MTRAPDLADTLRAIAFRVTKENVSANLGYKFGQDEETYNIVAAHGYFGRLLFQDASFSNGLHLSVSRHGPASWMPTPFPLIGLSFPQPACLSAFDSFSGFVQAPKSRNSSKGSAGEDRYADGCKYGGFRKSQDLAFSG